MELSAYSLIPDYLQNMNGGMVPAKTNMAITAGKEVFQNNGNNGNNNDNNQRNNNNNRQNIECYNCGRKGHISKDCRAPARQNQNQNRNNTQSLMFAPLEGKSANNSNSTNNENNVIFNSREQENITLNKGKSVKWRESLEEFRENEPHQEIL
ncbi:zinc finger CCHC domain-containing protein 14 [Rhizophagus clarus]|uniref:Zinc finger CCHC domain-containing protein 14 n=1 Tax=Rhizophagus clarus TaxID=94130 RepID=A0A8H3MH25_9GLOM|nr:zinc finger CCHC domain-containing protein 14 [Rhizophagus clarus]